MPRLFDRLSQKERALNGLRPIKHVPADEEEL